MTKPSEKRRRIKKIDYVLMVAFLLAVVLALIGALLSSGFFLPAAVSQSISSPPQSYTCPKTEWVDCMPILTPEAQKLCTKEYLAWAKSSCRGFKGAAY
jgi:hypothetical protein